MTTTKSTIDSSYKYVKKPTNAAGLSPYFGQLNTLYTHNQGYAKVVHLSTAHCNAPGASYPEVLTCLKSGTGMHGPHISPAMNGNAIENA